ncbi:ABC transporter permease [Paenibacillus sp. PK4536]|uniref:Oligopeptide transport system permease protein OppB n=1 Tax=Paenibacillus nuruki TaxID=1886670 RepID=A0A1E3LA98_9BACL|nr:MULTISPECIES: oligopeptide ABC transporter permease [Paenibacillus]ODP30095.1 Oligopeptide transport system permease protein OppB [Paenibacillus nuruki]TKJ92657.1 ABC transporter permease [Paenibacillus sp. CFBP13512]WIM38587.1 ABC transporter permease [Paenibacillus sp. PK4536]CAJ1314732.1 Peptide ABC transporter permease [Paenibacillus nuruki]
MWKFTLRRILIMIPQLFVLSVLIFLLAKAMPGDALTGAMQANPNVSPQVLAEQREKLGLNDPAWQQYGRWVGNLVQGDLGKSYVHKIGVADLIGSRLANTFYLGVAILVLTYLISIPLGILSGRYQNSLLDKTITGYTYLSFATPLFIFALLILFVFGFQLGWFPTSGSVDVGIDPGSGSYYANKFYHLILPAIAGALVSTTATIQYLRNEVIDTRLKDFVKTARSKGVPESKVYSKHILRNSLLPIAAFLGYDLTGVLAGNLFIESIFGYPGLGQLFLQSITQRDYSVVTILVMLSGLLALIGTLLSDIILSWVDPRIRIG